MRAPEHPLSHSYLCCISCCLPQVPKHINGSCFLSFFHSQHLPLSPSHAHTFITCSRLVLPGLAVVARRVDSSRCLELPGVAAGADARPCDICTHFITNNPVQVFTSQYIKMTLLRALVITFICMYVCMYVGVYVSICACMYIIHIAS